MSESDSQGWEERAEGAPGGDPDASQALDTDLVLAAGESIMQPPEPPPSPEAALGEVLSTELAGTTLRDLTQFAGLVRALWRSSFCDHPRWEDALYIALAGADVGMGPTQALRSINVIDGRPTLSADAIAAICRRSPLCRYLRPVEMTPLTSMWATWREGDPKEVRYTFSLDDARRAGLADGEFYRRYPAAMLKARTPSHLCRAVFPDLIGGFYDPSDRGDLPTLPPRRPAPPRPNPFAPLLLLARRRVGLASIRPSTPSTTRAPSPLLFLVERPRGYARTLFRVRRALAALAGARLPRGPRRPGVLSPMGRVLRACWRRRASARRRPRRRHRVA